MPNLVKICEQLLTVQ